MKIYTQLRYSSRSTSLARTMPAAQRGVKKTVNDKLYVAWLPEENCEIEIYDCYGRLLFKKQNSVNDLLIDLQDYSNGLYHLRVYNKPLHYRTNFVILNKSISKLND